VNLVTVLRAALKLRWLLQRESTDEVHWLQGALSVSGYSFADVLPIAQGPVFRS